MNNLHVKTGDTAVVLSGKEKGKRGKVLSVDPKKGMVVIEGVNMVKCHTKPRRQGETGGSSSARRAACLQGHARVSEVQQADPCCAQVCRERREADGVQALWRDAVRRGGCNKWFEYESEVYCGRCACSDEEVPVQEHDADPDDRQGRRQRRLRQGGQR